MAPCAQPCQRATVNRSAAPCERARFARVARAAWHQGGGTGRVDALRGGPLSQAVGGRAPSLAATAPQRKLLAPKPPLDFLGVSNQLSAVLARARLQSRTAVLRGGLTGEQARAALRGCGARNAPPASSWLLRPPHRPRKAGAARRSRAAGAWRPPPGRGTGMQRPPSRYGKHSTESAERGIVSAHWQPLHWVRSLFKQHPSCVQVAAAACEVKGRQAILQPNTKINSVSQRQQRGCRWRPRDARRLSAPQ